MSLPQDIVSAALVGTERQAVALPPGSEALGKLLSQLDPNQREASLLGSAGILSVYQRVGRLPTPAEAGAVPVPCAAEESPYCSAVANDHLSMMLAGQNAEVLREWLAAAAAAGKIVRPELLPRLLELGRNQTDSREALLPLSGKRGRWLAAQNPDWNYVAGGGEDESIWQTGGRAARVLLLQRLRAREPQRARELLSSTWAQEPADERVRFFPLLRTGLSAADEPFLEAALDDRRKEVRDEAARLLALIPDSRLNQRMLERARALLKFTPSAGRKKATLEVTLPESCDAAMKRDGIGANAQAGKGEKGGWLIQIVSLVRPGFWCESWGKTPEEILLASEATDWKKELFEGWVHAATHHGDAVWAESLLPSCEKAQTLQWLDGLMRALPGQRREAVVLGMMAKSKESDFGNTILGLSLRSCRHPWSKDFTRTILNELRRACAGKNGLDWPVQSLLKEIACSMDPALAKEAETGWPAGSAGWEHSADMVNQMLSLLQFRHQMLEELKK